MAFRRKYIGLSWAKWLAHIVLPVAKKTSWRLEKVELIGIYSTTVLPSIVMNFLRVLFLGQLSFTGWEWRKEGVSNIAIVTKKQKQSTNSSISQVLWKKLKKVISRSLNLEGVHFFSGHVIFVHLRLADGTQHFPAFYLN